MTNAKKELFLKLKNPSTQIPQSTDITIVNKAVNSGEIVEEEKFSS